MEAFVKKWRHQYFYGGVIKDGQLWGNIIEDEECLSILLYARTQGMYLSWGNPMIHFMGRPENLSFLKLLQILNMTKCHIWGLHFESHHRLWELGPRVWEILPEPARDRTASIWNKNLHPSSLMVSAEFIAMGLLQKRYQAGGENYS